MADAVKEIAKELDLDIKVAYIDGDDLAPRMQELQAEGEIFSNMDTAVDLADSKSTLLTANAYLGAWGIKEALDQGADIVICPRVTDAAQEVNLFADEIVPVTATKLQTVESDNVITTSSTPATFDVALLLIQRFFGDRAAEYASHYFTIRDKDAPLPEFLQPSSHDALVDAARDKMRMNYAQDLTLQELAALFNVTPRTLSRRFVGATGISPIQYLIKQRLNIARNLLQSTDLQIQQIAEQSGFGSATVFCRNFKKEFKQSPRQYRATLSREK